MNNTDITQKSTSIIGAILLFLFLLGPVVIWLGVCLAIAVRLFQGIVY